MSDFSLSWEVLVFLLELPDASQSEVKLLGAAEESQVGGLEHAILRGGSRVVNALLEAVIGHFLCHFDIFNEPLSLVGVEASCVHLHLETEAVNNLDLSGGKGVQLGHALHFDELHIVAILEFVTLIFVNGDNAGIGLGRCHYDEGLGVLAISIGDTEIVTIVKEGETLRAIGL